jgi:RES domain-containing protein
MATFFRIVQAQRAATAMDGEGGRLFGGRWNPPGMAAVYLAESRALAALEILVHAPREAMLLEWCLIEVAVPDAWIEAVKPARLPADWLARPSSPGARQLGGKWLQLRSGVALRLPSVIIPQEHILLINPLHPQAARLEVSAPREFRLDLRF